MGIKTIEDEIWQELLRLRQLEKILVPALRAVWADINNLGWVGPVAHQMAKEAIEATGGDE